MNIYRWSASLILISAIAGGGYALAEWKRTSLQEAADAAASQPEPAETVVITTSRPQEHRQVTTAIGTVLALRSVTLRNELAGTVAHTALKSGQIVEQGTVLVALDVSVEEAELKALEAQSVLAEATLNRMQRLTRDRAATEMDVDRARAERDVALAQISRTQAVMARKTLRAPFKARVGLADLHPGQYLVEGTELTTLQGVDEGVHVDFSVTQNVAASLREGHTVDVLTTGENTVVKAKIVALDSRIDPKTRNAWVRARIEDARKAPAPGASVRVRVPVGEASQVVAVSISALRRGPEGDHVYVVKNDKDGNPRAHLRLVQTLAVQGDDVLLRSGLKAGEQVAASGSFKLREAVLVAAAPNETSSAAAGTSLK